jgi:hypothetical protein
MKCPQQPNRARMADGGKGHRAEPKEEAPLANDSTTNQRFFVNWKKVQEFRQKCYERLRPKVKAPPQRAIEPRTSGIRNVRKVSRFVGIRIFAPSYGRVFFGKAPNLHAGSSQAERRQEWRLRCSLFRSLLLFGLPGVSF